MSSNNKAVTSNGAPATPARSYPAPEAEYAEIVQDAALFIRKFYNFHSSFGSGKFKIPTIGGTPLDVHRLFVEVTSRGGAERVGIDRRWKEVALGFGYPSTITSASFVLRKYYQSLLYHFEQVYYLRKETCPVAADSVTTIGNGSSAQYLEDSASMQHPSVTSPLQPGSLLNGTVEAKFEWGYYVNVEMGGKKLHGVMYHIPTESDTSQNSNCGGQNGFEDLSKFEKSSGYRYFHDEIYIKLKPLYATEEAVEDKILHMWSRLTVEDHTVSNMDAEQQQNDTEYHDHAEQHADYG